MKKSKWLRILAACVLAVCMLAAALPGYAAEWIDLDAKGSISVTLRDTDGKAVSGGELTLYRVAEVKHEDGDLSFAYTNGFAGCGVPLGDLTAAGLAGELREKIADSAVYTTKTVGQDGKVKFSDLELGLYLVVQSKAADGYYAVSPFLVTVPMTEDGGYLYNVDASPKVESARDKPGDGGGSSPTPTPVPPVPTPQPGGSLPQTGQLNWPVPVLAALGLGVFALGWWLREKNSEQ